MRPELADGLFTTEASGKPRTPFYVNDQHAFPTSLVTQLPGVYGLWDPLISLTCLFLRHVFVLSCPAIHFKSNSSLSNTGM